MCCNKHTAGSDVPIVFLGDEIGNCSRLQRGERGAYRGGGLDGLGLADLGGAAGSQGHGLLGGLGGLHTQDIAAEDGTETRNLVSMWNRKGIPFWEEGRVATNSPNAESLTVKRYRASTTTLAPTPFPSLNNAVRMTARLHHDCTETEECVQCRAQTGLPLVPKAARSRSSHDLGSRCCGIDRTGSADVTPNVRTTHRRRLPKCLIVISRRLQNPPTWHETAPTRIGPMRRQTRREKAGAVAE